MSEEVKKANQTRAQKAKIEHEKRTKERLNESRVLKAVYMRERDGDLLEDILVKAKKFMSYHLKIAQDGMGARTTGHKLTDGTPEVENYFLKPAERCSNLDKAAGIQEIVDYIERQTADPVPVKTQAVK